MSAQAEFDAYYKWLGIPPQHQPPTHYRLLGLEAFEPDLDVIQSAADRQMAHVQSHKIGPQSELSQRLLNEIARAKICLLNCSSKIEYDRLLKQQLTSAPTLATAASTAVTHPPETDQVIFQAVPTSIIVEDLLSSSVDYSQRRNPRIASNGRRVTRTPRSLLLVLSLLAGLVIVASLAVYLGMPDGGRLDDGPVVDAPSLKPDPPPAPVPNRPAPDTLVLYNEHNGYLNDGGAKTVNIYLLDARKTVWQVLNREMDWGQGRDIATMIEIPRRNIDAIRVEITSWNGSHGGLSEIEFWRDSTNLARGRFATASEPTASGDSRLSHCVTDGITNSDSFHRGYWTLPERKSGWIEIDLNRAAPLLEVPPNTPQNPIPEEPDKDGYIALFNGKDLSGWTGNTSLFSVENGSLVHGQSSRGNLYTVKQYSDFVLRFDYKLSAGADNGIGIRAPTSDDPTYSGMEVQLLDESAKRFRAIPRWQTNGAVCGVAIAMQGHQKPVGEWNSQEIIAHGHHLTVNLNGTTILETDLPSGKKAETLDKKIHPGLTRSRGHIVLMGDTPRVEFSNIRLRTLDAKRPEPPIVTPTPAPPSGTFPEIKLPSGRLINEGLLRMTTQEVKKHFGRPSRELRSPRMLNEAVCFVLMDPQKQMPVGLFDFNSKGKFDGLGLVVGDKGRPSVVTSYTAGQRNGIMRSWDSDGELVSWSEYKNGKKNGITCLCENGRPVRIEEWAAGLRQTYLIEYDENSAATVEMKNASSTQRDRFEETAKTLRSVERLLQTHEQAWSTVFIAWWRKADQELQSALNLSKKDAQLKALQAENLKARESVLSGF